MVINPDTVAEELRRHRGNMAAVGRALGVTRSAVWKHVNANLELKEIVIECREAMKDAVENAFYEDCLKDNPAYQTSRIFFLKTQCKDRDYVERQEITGKDGKAMQFQNVSDDDLDRRIADLQARIAVVVGGEGETAGVQADAASIPPNN